MSTSTLAKGVLGPCLAIGFVLAGCGGSNPDVDTATPSSSTELSTPSTTIGDTDTDEQPPESAISPTSTALEVPQLIPAIETEPADAGPRPTLAWSPVEGADRYTVVVLDVEGRPYWAWSGTETSTPMGGIDDAEVVGPWVHQPMTWTVAATNADGDAIALSAPSELTP